MTVVAMVISEKIGVELDIDPLYFLVTSVYGFIQ